MGAVMDQKQMDGILHRPIECERCQDEGWCECQECDGELDAKCEECHGEGTVYCYHCGNENDCKECRGKGVCKCSHCDGLDETFCDCTWGRAKRGHEMGIIKRAKKLAAK